MFASLIKPLTIEKFVEEYWGKKVFVTRVSEELLETLSTEFEDGQMDRLMPFCRNEDNTTMSPETMQNIEKDFQENKTTVSLPFCFNPGATELRNSFIQSCSGLGNDVEVGLYFSQTGGQPKGWHFDVNHNLTLQLTGQKDWSVLPGNLNAMNPREAAEGPKNRLEQQHCHFPKDSDSATVYNLQPGSVIYLPPGFWHSVKSVGRDDSCSVDVRVASVVKCKWLCEALFAGLLQHSYFLPDSSSAPLREIGPRDLRDPSSGGKAPRKKERPVSHDPTSGRALCNPYAVLGFEDEAECISQLLPQMLRRCRMLRCFPSQEEHSNGMHKGATLTFLHDDMQFRCLEPGKFNQYSIGVNTLVAITLKQRDDSKLIVQMFAQSGLTSMEYLNFSLICNIDLSEPVRLLVQEKGNVDAAKLFELCESSKKRQSLEKLLRVLLHGNVLFYEFVGGPSASTPPTKRKRVQK